MGAPGPAYVGTGESETHNHINIQSDGISLYERHEGGPRSRALGTAVHTLLEELSKLRTANDWQTARAALPQFTPRINANIRAVGIPSSHADEIAASALDLAIKCSHDPIGQWILSPRAEAASELRFTGVVSGSLRTIQVDRLFRAGHTPLTEGEDAWWIIDYKTAHSDNFNPVPFLPELRSLFAPQLQSYAAILRNLRGKDAIVRAGLYYPRMSAFDWWVI